jgi:dTDP-4-dehydrorhamnose 3,5-epimerase-like enzyme
MSMVHFRQDNHGTTSPGATLRGLHQGEHFQPQEDKSRA